MDHAIAFDTLAYAKKLKIAGFSEQQAEVQAEALVALVEERLATKKDVADLKRDLAMIEANLRQDMATIDANLRRDMTSMEANLRRDMAAMETNLKRDMAAMETNLKRDMKELELRLTHSLTLRLGGMLVTGVAVVAALVKLL